MQTAIRISPELHKRLKLRAIHNGVSLKDITESMLSKGLKHGS